ncbi:MAG: phytoene/squalene synthase family protein [Ectothiorhodospiraceae bacterium]
MTSVALVSSEQPELGLQRHARSFAWAARFLPRSTRHDAAELYAFCRAVDDLADGDDPENGEASLEAIREALAVGDTAHPVAGPFLALVGRSGIDVTPAISLVDGVRSDLKAVEITTTDELIRYAYRVAGTVGLMMNPLLGVTHRDAAPFAVDLGIAMQLTNIARDVVEDGERGRRYLPADRLEGAVAPQRLAHPEPDLRVTAFDAILGLLETADRYYASAQVGMAFIPRRPRLAILTAARLYRAIGERIRELGPQAYWQGRASVPRMTKTGLTISSVTSWLPPHPASTPEHDASLHTPIAGWAGADPRARA